MSSVNCKVYADTGNRVSKSKTPTSQPATASATVPESKRKSLHSNSNTHIQDLLTRRDLNSHQSSLLFPVIDSFPQVFASGNTVQKLAVHATLSTTTSVAQRIRAVERIARSIIGIDEREALCDGLVGICEEYEDGWESGSESDDDA
jgi:hypothetical protein